MLSAQVCISIKVPPTAQVVVMHPSFSSEMMLGRDDECHGQPNEFALLLCEMVPRHGPRRRIGRWRQGSDHPDQL